jgi:hypothetical protein
MNKVPAAVLYINGLGTEHAFVPALQKYWQRAGVDFEPAVVDWYDGKSLAGKLRRLDRQIANLLKNHDRLILLGSSAGASLAVNSFVRHLDDPVCVSVHGRLRRGNVCWPDWRTLERAAHLRSERPSQSFYNSVKMCENETLPVLGAKDLSRIEIFKPLIDPVVPQKTMNVPGTKTHRMLALGHKHAAIAHLIFGRDRTLKFAKVVL